MLELKSIKKHFRYHFKKLAVLDDIDLNINRGEFIALMGKSGSGKTTLLNIIAGLLKPSSGSLSFNGRRLSRFDFLLSRYRRKNIGFVFQNFNLINYLSVLDNVTMPLKFNAQDKFNYRKLGLSILDKVGLKTKASFYPGMLSGGQLQRCAIARALINKPALIIADEPTGNLDFETASEILEIFKTLNKDEGITFIVVTHEKSVIDIASRIITLENGNIKEGISEANLKNK
jgi:putative ABC transport system ATP-binding protein